MGWSSDALRKSIGLSQSEFYAQSAPYVVEVFESARRGRVCSYWIDVGMIRAFSIPDVASVEAECVHC